MNNSPDSHCINKVALIALTRYVLWYRLNATSHSQVVCTVVQEKTLHTGPGLKRIVNLPSGYPGTNTARISYG